MKYLKLLLLVFGFVVGGVFSSFATDLNFSYGRVIGLELFNTLDENTKADFDKNIYNLPNSMVDLHKRKGGTLYFIEDQIPNYNDGASSSTFGDNVMGACYQGGIHDNDIYVRIDKDLADTSYYTHYWRTISHEYGHFAYNNTLNNWTSDMRNALSDEFNQVKDLDYKCYNESETFAHEYSKYVESESLVSEDMANLFRKVENMVAEEDRHITRAYNIDEARVENIVDHSDDMINNMFNNWNNDDCTYSIMNSEDLDKIAISIIGNYQPIVNDEVQQI